MIRMLSALAVQSAEYTSASADRDILVLGHREIVMLAYGVHTNNIRVQLIVRRARPTQPPLKRAAYLKISAHATLATKGTRQEIFHAQVIVGHQ